jgi:ribosome biogenesis protein YTM1
MSDLPHEDWVSSVSCQLKKSVFFFRSLTKTILTVFVVIFWPSYDGQIRAFDYSKTLVSSSLLHPAPITSLCIISSNEEEGSYTIATSSHDLTAQLSQFTIRPSSMDIDNSSSISTSKPLASLHLHTACFFCIIQFHRDSPAHVVLGWSNKLMGCFNSFVWRSPRTGPKRTWS